MSSIELWSLAQRLLRSWLSMLVEVLDLDALTGGFNLQIAWSTSWLAVKNMLEVIENEF